MLSAEPFLRFTVDVGEPQVVGTVAGQVRRCVPLLGGTVEGEYRGRVVPGGVDWQLVATDGTLEISARYLVELEEGTVEVQSNGLRAGPPEVLARLAAGESVNPVDYYFRTAMRFFTASPALAALNRTLAVAVGERQATRVLLNIHRVP